VFRYSVPIPSEITYGASGVSAVCAMSYMSVAFLCLRVCQLQAGGLSKHIFAIFTSRPKSEIDCNVTIAICRRYYGGSCESSFGYLTKHSCKTCDWYRSRCFCVFCEICIVGRRPIIVVFQTSLCLTLWNAHLLSRTIPVSTHARILFRQ